MIDFISQFNDLIENEKKAILSSKWWFRGLLFIGFGIFLLTFFINFKSDIVADITKFAGPLISAISALPFSQIWTRREKLIIYEHFKRGFENTDEGSEEYRSLVQIALDFMKEKMKK